MSDRRIALALGVVASAVLVALPLGVETVYDYYGRLGEAFARGRWWLVEAPTWLNELVPCGELRWCVVYPPLPALLAAPLTLVLPTATAQGLVSQLTAGISTGVLYLALRALSFPFRVSLAGALLSAFGTTLLFSAADARAWYAAHAVAVLFTAWALLLAARGRPIALGAAIGLAALARLPVAGAMFGLALLVADRARIPYRVALLRVIAGGAPFALIYVAYNVLRWGSVFDIGYVALTVDDVFFRYGLFSPLYLPRHLYAIFLESPELVEDTWAFVRFKIVGMGLFLTTPALLWIFAGLRHVRRELVVRACAIAAFGALLPDVLHGTVGFAQFGYRFSLDAQPFLILLALVGDTASSQGGSAPLPPPRSSPSVLFIVACVVAVIVNVYGAIALIHFGYW